MSSSTNKNSSIEKTTQITSFLRQVVKRESGSCHLTLFGSSAILLFIVTPSSIIGSRSSDHQFPLSCVKW